MTRPSAWVVMRGALLCAALCCGMLVPAALAQLRRGMVQPAARGQDDGVVGVVSGGVDGTYVRIAADLAAVLDESGRLRVIPMLGKGSVQNVDDILHLRGVDIGIVQSDVLAYIRQRRILPGAERAVQYVAKLYDEELHILARRDIERLQDLAGQPVNFDVRGSGTALTASIVFEGLGIAVQVANDDQATALEKLRRGEIAALAYVAGKPARLFSGVNAGTGLHLLPVAMSQALLETYVPSQLGHDDYPALVPEGPPVETVAVGAVMAVYAWQPGTERYRKVTRFVDSLFDGIAKFRLPPRHPKWREVNLEAQVPGWTRFPAAEEALKRKPAGTAPGASPSAAPPSGTAPPRIP